MDFTAVLAKELSLSPNHVAQVIQLLDDGNTIPFIARYRKEMTGSMDDQVLRELFDRLQYLRNLEKRKEEVLASIESQDKLTDELQKAVESAQTLAAVEDLYRPYKQKRRTRASIAKERGLEPLAELLLEQKPDSADPLEMAAAFVDPEKEVETAEDALAGAQDIIAEQVSDNAKLRGLLRDFLMKQAVITTSGKTEEDTVYQMYYEFSEPVAKIPGHRVLAIDRGEREGVLKVNLECDRDRCLDYLYKEMLQKPSPASDVIRTACDDAFDRLVFPSLEREVRNTLTENAAESSMKVFALNLKQLLMQPPVKGAVTLGLDPAYRTGCKIAVVDATGKVLATTVIYPTPPQKKIAEAKQTIKSLIAKYNVSVISIGNGTASRESEMFVADTLHEIDQPVAYMVVSEAGASVYSASKLAAEEFPEYDVSLRSAVSIARRLQDPLAELVKIDPKAIGVGQYQHDMPQKRLGESLGGVVESCVNTVGVDLNTASESLLSYVAGVNKSIAKNIVAFREESGGFSGRKQLLKVPKLGKKAYEQCAGFLRVPESKDPLDYTGVHPESYKAAHALLEKLECSDADLKRGGIPDIGERAKAYGMNQLANELEIGLPTLRDILSELSKPGRDPRDELPKPLLRTDVMGLEDLEVGMELDGTVRNVIDFGAFVDIGVHEDGLVHISQLSNRYVKHPSEVVKVGDIVKVRVISVDVARKRIGLSMKKENAAK